MALVEINFDGLVGPSHNYSGLSFGNPAAMENEGKPSYPRDAALQGVAKMRHNLGLGLAQGILLPHRRPQREWLKRLGTTLETVPDLLRPSVFSASAMWAANAATVSPAPDTSDGRCHLTVANLRTMAHRSIEWPETLAQLRIAFADDRYFAVHEPIPGTFGDEGAANHMRLCDRHDAAGVEVFVYGVRGGKYPVRQHLEASRALARINLTDPELTLYAQQAERAIDAGAFHNDVVAVANQHVLFTHEQAYERKDEFYADLRKRLSGVEIVEVPAEVVSLKQAIKTYLFNAQLVSLAAGGMALVLPSEVKKSRRVWAWLETMVAGNGPIRELRMVDVRQSMANGGGPACLRLRVVADPATVDPRFLVDAAKLTRIERVVAAEWPDRITPDDLLRPVLWEKMERARLAVLEELELGELA